MKGSEKIITFQSFCIAKHKHVLILYFVKKKRLLTLIFHSYHCSIFNKEISIFNYLQISCLSMA